jgi:hypothetical protein
MNSACKKKSGVGLGKNTQMWGRQTQLAKTNHTKLKDEDNFCLQNTRAENAGPFCKTWPCLVGPILDVQNLHGARFCTVAFRLYL